MSHFACRPIRIAWMAIIFPALMVNYLGQGALLLLRNGGAAQNPFYLLAPEEWWLPLLILATVATIVASQAVMAGAFSVGALPVLKTSYFISRQTLIASKAPA